VDQTLFAMKKLDSLHVFAMVDSKVTVTTAQISMSAKTSRVMNVTLTPYVPTPKELTFVAVFVVTKETAGPVQTSMNVLKQTNVTGTLSAPTRKDRIFAAVKRVMLAMVKTAQIVMNVQLRMIVTATPCVLTLKDPTSVDV